MHRLLRTALLLLVMNLPWSSMYASEVLDIEAELARPGVKLVVVEFYATWCKPCLEAVPKWKALHNKYKNKGLRFIVVSAEGDQICSRPPDWSPDLALCDMDGALASTMEVKKLPTSFLYSWDGAIHLKSFSIEPVEQAIERYFENVHLNLLVDQVEVIGDKLAISGNERWVRDAVISHITQTSRFDVVRASPNPLERHLETACPMNPALPVNSILRITLQGHDSGERYLTLGIEKDGCVIAKAQESYTGEGLQENEESLQNAIARAVNRLIGQVIQVRKAEEFTGDSFLFVNSEPSGAMVYVNGEMYSRTPFQQKFPIGHYTIEVRKGKLYKPAKEQVVLTGETKRLNMHMQKDYGILEVASTPAGADIYINGEPTGFQTPHTFPPKKNGTYQVSLQLANYQETTKEAVLGSGKHITLIFPLPKNYANLTVHSKPAGGSIVINGKDSGKRTPYTFSPFKIGTWDIEVCMKGYRSAKQVVTLQRNQEKSILLKPVPKYGWLEVMSSLCDGGDGKCTASESRVYIDGKEAFMSPGRKRLLEGGYYIEVTDSMGRQPYAQRIRVRENQNTLVNARIPKQLPEEIRRQRRVERLRAMESAKAKWDIQVEKLTGKRKNLKLLGGWLTGVGCVSSLAGSISLILAHTHYKSLLDESRASSSLSIYRDDMIKSETAGWAMLGVGVPMLISGIVVLAVAPRLTEISEFSFTQAQNDVRIVPTAGSNGRDVIFGVFGEF